MLFVCCREIGEKIASFLSMFSLDVCGIIGKYAICDQPRQGKEPIKMISFETPTTHYLQTMAIHPLTGHLWMTYASTYLNGIFIFDKNGKELDRIPFSSTPCNLTITSNGVVFILMLGNMIYTIDSDKNCIKQKRSTFKSIEYMTSDDHGFDFAATPDAIFQLDSKSHIVQEWSFEGRLLAAIDDEHLLISELDTIKVTCFVFGLS